MHSDDEEMSVKEKHSTSVIAYNGEDCVNVELKYNSSNKFTAFLGKDDVFSNDKYKDMTFLVPIDNTIKTINREQFGKYLLAYRISTNMI